MNRPASSTRPHWRRTAAERGIAIRPLAPCLGSEVEGVDLDRPLDAEAADLLRAACDERGVLVFRGCGRIGGPALAAIARIVAAARACDRVERGASAEATITVLHAPDGRGVGAETRFTDHLDSPKKSAALSDRLNDRQIVVVHRPAYTHRWRAGDILLVGARYGRIVGASAAIGVPRGDAERPPTPPAHAAGIPYPQVHAS